MRAPICLVLVCLVALWGGVQCDEYEWNYNPCEDGPDTWGEHYPICADGQKQSPIDITTFETFEDPSLQPLKFDWDKGFGKPFFNGETCQTNIPDKSMYITKGPLGDDKYYMTQFHTHEVSEHHIDGMAYPLEMHFVHKNAAGLSNQALYLQLGNLAVVGFFFRVSNQDSKFISEFIDFCFANASSTVDRPLDFSALLDFPTVGFVPYYTYQGSLTTPPCTEHVTWILISEIFSVSRAQLNEFMDILPHHIANNRPIQTINDRTVRYFSGIKPEVNVEELGLRYEVCEEKEPVMPSEKRNNWSNMTLSIKELAPGEAKYFAVQIFDIPSSPPFDISYLRIALESLSGKVLLRLRQVRNTPKVNTKTNFFFLTKYQRLQFYQERLPGEEPHDNDVTYPAEQIVSDCSNNFDCGYVLTNPALDLTDVLPVFLVEIENIGDKTITNVKVSAYAGDKTPNCQIAPVGIVIGSLWSATIVLIIAVTIALLAFEKTQMQKQKQ